MPSRSDYVPNAYQGTPSISNSATIAHQRPGMTWIIGNEMDRVDGTTSNGVCSRQDDMLPELYAQVYHDYYYAIKAADPTANVAIGGMVEFTNLRQQYLKKSGITY